MTLSVKELIEFEDEIKELFLQGKIRSPVHLSGGNEFYLIDIFKKIKPNDWVFSTHRSHYHALLKGIPSIKEEILKNHSINLNSKKHKFFTSAIVGGCIPIALGVAFKSKDHVWCFVGDMSSETGIFHECTKYAGGHNLPITFIVEDNGLSVNTPTKEVWGEDDADIIRYSYERTYPHQGSGQFVTF